MSNFESTLRQALMDANLLQFEAVLNGADAMEPDFSPKYCRERMRMLTDPFVWLKRRCRPVWKKALRNIACVLLACALTLGSLMAVSPTVRAAVLNWLKEISYYGIHYVLNGGDSKVYEEVPAWRPTWLPENWLLDNVSNSLVDISSDGETKEDRPGGWFSKWEYLNGEDRLSFQCTHSVDNADVAMQLGVFPDDIEKADQTTVWGKSADFYQDYEGNACLVWGGEGGELFQLTGPLEMEDMKEIAEKVMEVDTEPLPVYCLNWLPEGSSEPYFRKDLHEAVREQFHLADGTICTWMYAAESVGPLAKPSGVPKPVEICGTKGIYWGAENPAASGIMIGSGDSIKIYNPSGLGKESTLLWVDPGTNISFRIQGQLEKEELLKIAENITLHEPSK